MGAWVLGDQIRLFWLSHEVTMPIPLLSPFSFAPFCRRFHRPEGKGKGKEKHLIKRTWSAADELHDCKHRKMHVVVFSSRWKFSAVKIIPSSFSRPCMEGESRVQRSRATSRKHCPRATYRGLIWWTWNHNFLGEAVPHDGTSLMFNEMQPYMPCGS